MNFDFCASAPPGRRLQAAIGRLAVLSLLLWLGACAGLPSSVHAQRGLGRELDRTALRAFTLDGRFSLRHADKSYAGRLSWRHDDDGDEVLLASPLGQGIAEIVNGVGGARLTSSDGREYSAENAETLTRQVLGYPLPLGNLADWLRARARPETPVDVDSLGRPSRLRENGWRVAYEYDSPDLQALPGRVLVEREGAEGFELRLRIDEWTSNTTQNPPSNPTSNDTSTSTPAPGAEDAKP